MTASEQRAVRVRRATLVLAVLLSILSLVQVNHRAGKGRNALLKWAPAFEKLERGEPLYGVPLRADAEEGYPTLPVSLLLLSPFHHAGGRAGPLLWAAFELAAAWALVLVALRLAAGRARDYPPWGALVVLVLSFRVLHGEVQHGNINLAVAAAVVGAGWSWARGRPLASGVLLGLGAVLKITPALGVLLFLVRKSVRGLVGFLVGVALFAVLVPGLWLGFARNAELAEGWWHQMAAPYVRGGALGATQTAQINQSLYGVLARWTTDSVAIEAHPPRWPADVHINFVSLTPASFRMLHRASALAVLVVAVIALVRARPRAPSPLDADPESERRALGEFALLSLAMVLLSERSWKHHWVLAPWALAYLVWHALRGPRGTRIPAAVGVGLAALLQGGTGDALLGDRGADLAEAYGAYLAGGLALYLSVAWVLGRPPAGSRAAECR